MCACVCVRVGVIKCVCVCVCVWVGGSSVVAGRCSGEEKRFKNVACVN